jgi:hypothetical protein
MAVVGGVLVWLLQRLLHLDLMEGLVSTLLWRMVSLQFQEDYRVVADSQQMEEGEGEVS